MKHVNGTVVSFADIAPAIERVDIRGTVIEMRGIPVLRCFQLIAEFPAIIGLFSGKIEVEKLLGEVPQAAAAIACEGLRQGNDEKRRAEFDQLVLGDQVKLVAAVLKATMPEGRDPFVQMAATLGLDLPAIPTSGKA